MAAVSEKVSLDQSTLARIQEELRGRGLEAWLLYDFRGANAVAGQLLGLPALSRRYFVLLPVEGRPVALTHRIEQQPWEGWIGEKRVYLEWRDLERELREMLAGHPRVAMEYDAGDAVPYVDRVPAGVVELVRGAGAEVVTSADLVSAFYSRWSPEGLASHRRAATIVQETARSAFRRIGERLRAGDVPTEWSIRRWIVEELVARGLSVGADAIVAVNAHAANPHFAPTAEAHAPIAPGDLVLIDLWGKERAQAIYADQTWMGFVGGEVPDRIRTIWEVVRDARDAAVDLIRSRHRSGQPVAGFEADDAARAVVRDAGYADAFIHRTGHSIDRELHGSGPNLDNFETRDTRLLIPGVGFSVEPGIYLPGDLGFRTEIDVFMGPEGPEVTVAEPQRELIRVET